MTFTTIDRPIEPADVQPDGTPWPFVLVRGEDTILADTAGDIVSFIVEDYEDIPDGIHGNDEALIARAVVAIRVCATAQAMMLMDAVNEGRFDVATADEKTLTALLGDRTIPVVDVDRWDHDVPLVLVATDYEPFTSEATPSGNVLWIDPSDELAFLESLSNLGLISFYAHGDA
ncbi:hypothetical protein [Nocardioides sp. Leaf285]|uniref:hypothetical protein n=1 Tax=Nocardioides sp. Leaf285 TaxID=1736322 RepID=UPI0007031E4D|nr:hypothetical protein [Nocardioides sp. Leaf285]KQP63161.1 hypothetical protein ASF47_19315 [Nocardioides sp. Leaf285]